MSSDAPITVALLAPPEATASTLYGLYDLFSSAGRDWTLVTEGRPGRSLFTPLIVSTDGRGFRAGNRAWIQPDMALADCPLPQAVCLPDLMVAPDEPLTGRYPAEIAWLCRCHAEGALLAAACTGALLFAEAGLLAGGEATTHWAYCEALATKYPDVRVHAHRSLVASGPGERLLMAGGGTSWLDLALFLVARLAGIEEAMHLARLYLIDWHREGQQPYAALTRARQTADGVIAECQVWAARHYDHRYPVAGMIRLSGLSERSFKRRFKAATGMTPIAYVHTLRLEEAKQMLESDDAPIEAIAESVGYEDASFFRRLFGRRVGLTPGQYRRRFRSLRLAIQQKATP
ncbi:GlxA family transcriptional regulator [Modicisalibacter coralii]|uniref:GlxA family transcriptional regulator n=1 Tax=Modicisalibacter coralii TaxID=2304602 RepID=UPI00100ACC3E|nr:helix-turn-helix domain-containing protein [Halomonas coralii]